MLLIKEIVNSIFTSKTYILYKEGRGSAWLVDIGDVEPVLAFLKEKGLTVAGVMITHGHFDHIYGLRRWWKVFLHVRSIRPNMARHRWLRIS